jgi:hypothetical protein
VTVPDFERRDTSERRSNADRRSGGADVPREGERRKSPRRSGVERRLALQSSAGQMQIAIGLLLRLAESSALNDEQRRLLDTAMLRLRFAIERIGNQ